MRRKGRGEIVKVSDLFKKYTERLIAPQGAVIDAFREVIEDLYGIRLKEEQCSFNVSTKTLTLTASGPIKSELLLRKAEILTHLKGRLGERSAPKELL